MWRKEKVRGRRVFAWPPRPRSGERKRPPRAFHLKCLGFWELKLIQPEADFYVQLHGHGLAIFLGGLKLPSEDGFHGLLVESQAQRAGYAHVVAAETGTNHAPPHPVSMFLRIQGSLR